jgi:ATPase subunit of ABC transporter with duplicated ATPase domains
MLILQNITYTHSNKSLLFSNINLTVNNGEKIALVGNNGVGKSTLLKLVSGELDFFRGQLKTDGIPYYVPQILGQFDHLTIAQALRVEDKLKALKEILNGQMSEENLELLNDDWTIEEKCADALSYWQLTDLELNRKMETLSGGQKTKVFLAGISIHQPELILLDEPSNHLDVESRELLYQFIRSSLCTIIVVSHDRKLLNLLNTVCELNAHGIKTYGGSYDFYAEQKQLESDALNHDLKSKEKALRKAKEKERETLERQHKLDARGRKKQEKAGVAAIMLNTLRNNAEKSTSKLKDVHAEKLAGISEELTELRKELPDISKIKFGFDHSRLHHGKRLFSASDINFKYNNRFLWKDNVNLEIVSGERVALTGANGSGKTTLIQLISGSLNPFVGTVKRAEMKLVCVDQDYSLIDNNLTVYEQARKFNDLALQEYEIKIRLNRFLFTKHSWDKSCKALSGGERMRLMLCCLTIEDQSPDIILLDEPTNNLDLQNILILTSAINEYQGTLIVISHDEDFLKEIRVERTIRLESLP